MRRYKSIIIRPDLIYAALMGRCQLSIEGCPSDTIFKEIYYDPLYAGWRVTLEHETFPEVQMNEMIPVVYFRVENIQCEPKIRFKEFT